jgi:hypothetical protein
MSATLETKQPSGQTKKEGKGERQEKKGEQQQAKGEHQTPQHAQKAQKWYPVVDERQPKKVGFNETIASPTITACRCRGDPLASVVFGLSSFCSSCPLILVDDHRVVGLQWQNVLWIVS